MYCDSWLEIFHLVEFNSTQALRRSRSTAVYWVGFVPLGESGGWHGRKKKNKHAFVVQPAFQFFTVIHDMNKYFFVYVLEWLIEALGKLKSAGVENMTFSTQTSNIYLLSSFDFFVLTVLVFVSFLLNRLNSSAWRLHRSCKFKGKQGGSNLRANFTCLHLLRSPNNCWRQTKANFNVSMPLSKEILVQYNHLQMFCR